MLFGGSDKWLLFFCNLQILGNQNNNYNNNILRASFMKKIACISLLVGSFLLQGCTSSTDNSQNILANFLTVHNEYCDAEFSHFSALTNALEKDRSYQPLADFDGIYEKTILNVSYAVSPEEDGCTTDLKLKVAGNKQLHFSFNQLNAELIAKGYMLKGEKSLRREMGLDNKMLQVMEQKYISPRNTITTLLFPLEREDQYYMTFFAEKYGMKDASLKQESDSNMFEI